MKQALLTMGTLETVVLIGAAVGSLGYLLTIAGRLAKTWFKFIEDWEGDGSEENPGVIERLKTGNERFDKIESEIAEIKAELYPNSGSSLRDSIIRIEHNTTKKPVRKTSRK